jgi:hypothetical protein
MPADCVVRRSPIAEDRTPDSLLAGRLFERNIHRQFLQVSTRNRSWEAEALHLPFKHPNPRFAGCGTGSNLDFRNAPRDTRPRVSASGGRVRRTLAGSRNLWVVSLISRSHRTAGRASRVRLRRAAHPYRCCRANFWGDDSGAPCPPREGVSAERWLVHATYGS